MNLPVNQKSPSGSPGVTHRSPYDPNHIPPGDDEFEVGKEDLRVLRGYGVTIETPSWWTVARIKGAGGISLGDSYAAALALEGTATLIVGADPEFGDLSADLDVYQIREESV
ncbi:MAG: hypothetical protein V5A43_06415 [Haloarculaceae archaeon]